MEFLDRTFYLDNNQNYESKIKNDIWCIMLILSGTYTITNYESKRIIWQGIREVRWKSFAGNVENFLS